MSAKTEAEARAAAGRVAEQLAAQRDVSRETISGPRPGAADVSRETIARLDAYAALLGRWNKTINLLSRNDFSRIWSRHILDSLGLWTALPAARRWIDLGSGGGFPALPLAIAARIAGFDTQFELFESDQRKAAFLRHAARELDTPVTVSCERVERADRRSADIISARAMAPLEGLLAYAEKIAEPGARLALLKGASVHDELTEAGRCWHIRYQAERHPLTLERNILWVWGFSRA